MASGPPAFSPLPPHHKLAFSFWGPRRASQANKKCHDVDMQQVHSTHYPPTTLDGGFRQGTTVRSSLPMVRRERYQV